MVSINQNLTLYAQQGLAEAQNALTTTVNALSTGKRVNAAQDDAASLAISQSLVSQIKTVNQSISNLNNATNVIQIADSGLDSIQNMVMRIKQLAVMGMNDGISNSQKVGIVKELDQINTEIDHVIDRTVFNGTGLLTNYGELDSKSALKLNVTNVGVLDNTVASVIDVAGARPGIYKFSSSGDQLTLTKADYNDNTFGSQTLTVASPTGSSYSQTLNFDDFGISVRLNSTTIGVNGLTDVAEEITRNLGNLFQPIIVNEAIQLRFGSDSGGSYINFRPINLSTTACPDAEWSTLPNQNGVSNSNTAAIQALPSPTTAKGTYAVTINQSAATTQFEYVGFNSTSSTVGINSDFSFTVGDRVYYANGNKVQGGVTSYSADRVLSGANVSISDFTNWVNNLNDSNVSARLYLRSGTGDYAVKIDGGLTGSDNAISFTGMNLAVAKNTLTGSKIYGTTSLNADGKITTSFSGYIVDDPYSATDISVSGGLSAYEGNGSQFLNFSGSDKWLYTNYTNKSDGAATSTRDGLLIGSELSPTPSYVSYYPYQNPYDPQYDPAYSGYIGYYLGTRNQAPNGYSYGYSTWDANFTSNLKLLTSVVNIDPARDANLTITTNGSTRRITNSSNVFTDLTSGLSLNITSNTQPWDTPASSTIVVGSANPPLPPNNSNLVAIDHVITTLKEYSTDQTNSEWAQLFEKLQNQSEKALNYLSYERGILGAQSNRIHYISTNLNSQNLNLEKSRSDLVDADIGDATAQFMRERVQLQAATEMVKEASSLASPIKTLIKLWDDIKSK